MISCRKTYWPTISSAVYLFIKNPLALYTLDFFADTLPRDNGVSLIARHKLHWGLSSASLCLFGAEPVALTLAPRFAPWERFYFAQPGWRAGPLYLQFPPPPRHHFFPPHRKERNSCATPIIRMWRAEVASWIHFSLPLTALLPAKHPIQSHVGKIGATSCYPRAVWHSWGRVKSTMCSRIWPCALWVCEDFVLNSSFYHHETGFGILGLRSRGYRFEPLMLLPTARLLTTRPPDRLLKAMVSLPDYYYI